MQEAYSRIRYDPEENVFEVTRIDGRYRTVGPLNVGFQITRRCNLQCVYCCESFPIGEMSLSQAKQTLDALVRAGTKLVQITGGEPLLRDDVCEIISYARELGLYVAMDTNATLVTDDIADFLARSLVYLESTVDGTPMTHNRVRGQFENVVRGIRKVRERGLPVYIVTVLLGNALNDVKYVAELSDDLGAKILKIVTPIPKGRGAKLPGEYLNNQHLWEIWEEICEFKRERDLRVKLILSDWGKVGPGSVILIHPNGDIVGSPSIGEFGCITPLGNIFEQDLREMWRRYPYAINHILRYTGETLYSSD